MTQKEHTQITQKTSSEIFLSLPEKIRFHRTKKGLSQETLAELLGISRQAVAKWESGAARPSTDRLIALCKIFEISPGELTRADRLRRTGESFSDLLRGSPRHIPQKKTFFSPASLGWYPDTHFLCRRNRPRSSGNTEYAALYRICRHRHRNFRDRATPAPASAVFGRPAADHHFSGAVAQRNSKVFQKTQKERQQSPPSFFDLPRSFPFVCSLWAAAVFFQRKKLPRQKNTPPLRKISLNQRLLLPTRHQILLWKKSIPWPENSYTSLVPKPSWGTPFLSTYSVSQHFFAVTFHTAARQEGEDYIHLLRDNGFSTVDRNSEKVSTGEVLENAQTYVSVAVSDNTFAVYIRPKTNG